MVCELPWSLILHFSVLACDPGGTSIHVPNSHLPRENTRLPRSSVEGSSGSRRQETQLRTHTSGVRDDPCVHRLQVPSPKLYRSLWQTLFCSSRCTLTELNYGSIDSRIAWLKGKGECRTVRPHLGSSQYIDNPASHGQATVVRAQISQLRERKDVYFCTVWKAVFCA